MVPPRTAKTMPANKKATDVQWLNAVITGIPERADQARTMARSDAGRVVFLAHQTLPLAAIRSG